LVGWLYLFYFILSIPGWIFTVGGSRHVFTQERPSRGPNYEILILGIKSPKYPKMGVDRHFTFKMTNRKLQ